ncbi:hypothetical protein B0H17DRAFT_331539, partial [Mycena rosella]
LLTNSLSQHCPLHWELLPWTQLWIKDLSPDPVTSFTLESDCRWTRCGLGARLSQLNGLKETEFHEKITLVKTLLPRASISMAQSGFSPPVSPRVFTVLQITHLDTSAPRTGPTGWVVHMPIDLTGAGDEDLRAGRARHKRPLCPRG